MTRARVSALQGSEAQTQCLAHEESLLLSRSSFQDSIENRTGQKTEIIKKKKKKKRTSSHNKWESEKEICGCAVPPGQLGYLKLFVDSSAQKNYFPVLQDFSQCASLGHYKCIC